MRICRFRTCVLAAALLAAFTCAGAVTVTVTPSDMQGWSIETNRYATAGIGPYGPARYERSVPFVGEDGTPLGRGAYYAECTYAGTTLQPDDTPSTAWLGLDVWNGQPLAGIALNRITQLSYYAYVARIPCQTQPGVGWESWTWWKYPRQPISLQLTVESPDGSQRRQLWYMPWHKTKVRGDNSGTNVRLWQFYNCMDTVVPVAVTRWYSPDPQEEYLSWDDLMLVYGDWKLVPTSSDRYPTGWKSCGWDETTDPVGAPTCTATGKCVNFEVGARKNWLPIFWETDNISWANDYKGFRGHVDFLTIGIDGVSVTYNFEPDDATPITPLVMHNNRAVTDPIMSYDIFTGTNASQRNHLHKVVGKVVRRANAYFDIDDGSDLQGVDWDGQPIYKPIRIQFEPGIHTAQVGQYYEVWGYMEKLRFNGEPYATDGLPPCFVWTDWGHCRRLQ